MSCGIVSRWCNRNRCEVCGICLANWDLNVYYSLARSQRSVLIDVQGNKDFSEVGRQKALFTHQSCSAVAIASSYLLPNFYIMNCQIFQFWWEWWTQPCPNSWQCQPSEHKQTTTNCSHRTDIQKAIVSIIILEWPLSCCMNGKEFVSCNIIWQCIASSL